MKKVLFLCGFVAFLFSLSCDLLTKNFLPFDGPTEPPIDFSKFLKSGSQEVDYAKALIKEHMVTATDLNANVNTFIGNGTKPDQVKTYENSSIKEIKDAANLSLDAQKEVTKQFNLLQGYSTSALLLKSNDITQAKQLQADTVSAMHKLLEQVSIVQIQGSVATSLGQNASVSAANAATLAAQALTLANARDGKQKAIDAVINNITNGIAAIAVKTAAIPDITNIGTTENQMIIDSKTIKAVAISNVPLRSGLAIYVDKVITDTVKAFGDIANARVEISTEVQKINDAKAVLLALKTAVATGSKDSDTLAAIQTLVGVQTTTLNDSSTKITSFATGLPANSNNPFADSCFIVSTGCDMASVTTKHVTFTGPSIGDKVNYFSANGNEMDFFIRSSNTMVYNTGVTAVAPTTFEFNGLTNPAIWAPGHFVGTDISAVKALQSGAILFKQKVVVLSDGTALTTP